MPCRQYVYAIVASPTNEFAEMAAVSSYLLKKADPDAHIVALIDAAHDDVNRRPYRVMWDTGVELRPVQILSDDPIYRSRWLKISVRSLIEGRFVYLDTDTLPLAGFSDIFAFSKDLGGVRDPYSVTSVRSPAFSALDWKLREDVYLNNGVLAWADSRAARGLATAWLEYYRRGYDIGEKRDQPALNQAIRQSGIQVERLPGAFNVMIRKSPLDVWQGRLLHIGTGIRQTAFDAVEDTVLHVASHRLKAEGSLPTELLDSFYRTGNPWITYTSWRQALGVRQYRRAAVLLAARIRQKLSKQGKPDTPPQHWAP